MRSTLHRTHREVRRFGCNEGAAAMVEFAIVAPLLFILLFGIIDAGKFLFEYHQLANAAREGARVGAVMPLQTKADYQFSHDRILATVRASLSGKKFDDRWLTIKETGSPPTRTIRVEINDYPYDGITPLFGKRSTMPTVAVEYRHEFQ